jgi:hypothetical protein
MLSRTLLYIVLVSAVASAQPYQVESYRLFHPAVDAQNLIYPCSIVVDEWRGICYIASDSLARISRISIPEKRLLGSYDERHGIMSPVRLHAADESQRFLYLSEHYTLPSRLRLLAYNLTTNTIADSLNLGPCNWLQVIADSKRNQLYVSSGRDHVVLLNANTLTPVDSIDVGVQTAGMYFDSTNSELFVCQFAPIQGLTTIQRFSVANHQRLGTMTFAASEPVTSVRVDPDLNRVMAMNARHVWLFDEFGILIFDYAINGGIGDIASSQTFHASYFVDVLGEAYPSRGGRIGKIVSFGFREFEVDSLAIGTGKQILAIHETSNTAVVVSKATTTASLYRLPDFFPLANIELGESVDQLALLPGKESIIALNHLGAENELTSIVPGKGRTQFPTGYFPASIVSIPDENRFAIVSHHESAVYIHDSTGSFIYSIASGLAHHGTRPRYPAICYNGNGKLLVAWAEQGVFSVIDLATQAMEYEFYIEGMDVGGGSGAGLIQPLFIPERNSFCFLSRVSRKLAIYNAANNQYERTIDLAGLDWSIIEPFEQSCLQSSDKPGQVFVGPYLIDTDGINEAQQMLPAHSRLLASTQLSTLWVIQSHADSLQVLEIENDTGTIISSIPLGEVHGTPDAIAVSIEDRRLILGYKDNAEIFDFRIDAVNSIRALPLAKTHQLGIYPNPYRADYSANLTVMLPVELQEDADLVVQDSQGKELSRVSIRSVNRQISLLLPAYSPGMYTIRVSSRHWQGTGQFVLVR